MRHRARLSDAAVKVGNRCSANIRTRDAKVSNVARAVVARATLSAATGQDLPWTSVRAKDYALRAWLCPFVLAKDTPFAQRSNVIGCFGDKLGKVWVVT
jgi:hypothetical protein